MKRIVTAVLSIAVSLAFSACMFYCFVAGAPDDYQGLRVYLVSAGAFSLLLPLFLCACLHYIFFLQNKLKKLEKILTR